RSLPRQGSPVVPVFPRPGSSVVRVPTNPQPTRPQGVRSLPRQGSCTETLSPSMLILMLSFNSDIITSDYTETHYKEDGTQVTEVPKEIDHCYYQGSIVNDSQSSASISTCDGLRGYFRTSAQRYLIEPLSSSDVGDHAVSTFNDNTFTPAMCGVTNTSWSDDFEPPTGRSRSRSKQKYIELFLVADNREYLKMKRDQTKLRQRIFEIVNFVNMAYKPLQTFIALVGIEIWSNRDQISVTPPAGKNLNAFMNWRNSELMTRKKHDNAHLISAIDFEGATVGLAYIGTLCSGHSVGVIQDHNDRAIAVGATLAHEMGHNLGMDHDDSSACVCTEDSCIMAAALSWNVPRTFSSCSATKYHKYLMSRNPSCLLDQPSYRSVVTPAVCGNGFRETGEQCDCGTLEECTNPCCNATSCTLKEGTQCAEGECCDNCQIAPRTKECRRKQDVCDLAEYCNGESTDCPEDMFAVNGLPCDSGLGYCYNGQCPQRMDQCVKMYGSSECLQRTQTSRPGPDIGQSFSDRSFFGDHTKDYGQVETGTECGNGKVCSQNQCVDLKTAYRNVNCSAKCAGHAVSTH
uniref:Zinc metalloproteinase-disintegrin-like crotastatin n=1 Tax=Gouania willdenowi TaxID=441366 RepID=A0A8C5NEX9_GOUWI